MKFALIALICLVLFIAAFFLHPRFPSPWKWVVFGLGVALLGGFAIMTPLFMAEQFKEVDPLKATYIGVFVDGMVISLFGAIHTRKMNKAFGISFLSIFLLLGILTIILSVQLSVNYFVPSTRENSQVSSAISSLLKIYR